MKNQKKTHWFRNTVLILAGCLIIGLIFSGILYARDNSRIYAVATMSFSFDGASEGKAPNGYRFDVNDITSTEVVEEALKNTGLDGQYTVEDIQANLTAQGVYPEDLISRLTKYNSLTDAASNQSISLVNYHPTVYSVMLYSDFDSSISKGQLTALLDSILTAYRGYFAKEYSMHPIIDANEAIKPDNDYFQQIEYLNYELDLGKGYAEEMAELAPSLRVNGKGFSEVAIQFDNLKTTDLSNLSATMTMNTLSKNLERLQAQYEFEIQKLENQIAIYNNMVENLDGLLATYGKSGIIYLSTTDVLNKVDAKSSKVYDSLVDMRNTITTKIGELNLQIATYQGKLSSLDESEVNAEEETEDTTKTEKTTATQTGQKATEAKKVQTGVIDTSQQAALLEAGLERIDLKYKTANEELTTLLNAYNEQEINEFTVIQSSTRYKAPSIFSGAFIKLVVKTAGPFMALGFMASMVLIIISRRREWKAHHGSVK